MKKHYIISICFIIIMLFIISIAKKDSKKVEIPLSSKKYDTISTPKDYQCEKDFYKYSDYQKRLNLYISTFYEIDEAIKAPNNDSIAILRPYYSIPGAMNCLPNREYEWLLLIKNSNDTIKPKIYKHVLHAVPYHSIHSLSVYEKGFVINVDISGNNYFGSRIYVNSQYNIDSISIESWGHHQYEKTYKYKDFPLDSFTYSHIEDLRERSDRAHSNE